MKEQPASTSSEEEIVNLSQLFGFTGFNYKNFSESQLQELIKRWPLLAELSTSTGSATLRE